MRPLRETIDDLWWITNFRILKRAGLPSLADMLITVTLTLVQGRETTEHEVERHHDARLAVQSIRPSFMKDSRSTENIEQSF